MGDRQYPEAEHGWSSSFPAFHEAEAPYIRDSLTAFLRDVSVQQLRAWDDSIKPLQHEVGEVLRHDPAAGAYSAILEYQLPMEHRRPDVILLIGGVVLVLELKGKDRAEIADIDQAAAYARDLRAYHRECADRPVQAALVLTRASGRLDDVEEIPVVGLDAVDELAAEFRGGASSVPLSRAQFLDPSAYRPLPTIVEAARELMESGSLRRIARADAATRPTLEYVSAVARSAAESNTRHLVLLSGLPGTGKTLVGLQLAHARFLDDLALDRANGKPTAPAVYLSGNGPLVEVLQYELRGAGGGGRTFVRAVKAYVQTYSRRPDAVPPEHVLIFDEAQRAFDAEQVRATHKEGPNDGKSEPEHFVEFAERIPGWCVVVGLIGSGPTFTRSFPSYSIRQPMSVYTTSPRDCNVPASTSGSPGISRLQRPISVSGTKALRMRDTVSSLPLATRRSGVSTFQMTGIRPSECKRVRGLVRVMTISLDGRVEPFGLV